MSEKKVKYLNSLSGNKNSKNKLVHGDGLDVLSDLVLSGEKFNIVMIDPPYNENKSKGKYQDLWKGSGKEYSWAGEKHGSYLDFLHPRITLGKEILENDGVMLLFIGDGEQHFVRILMDNIFGEDNYVGTVIWDSSSNQQKSKPIDRNHEYVLIYAKDISVFSKLGFHKQDGNSAVSRLDAFSKTLKENGKTYDENQIEYFNYYKTVAKEVNSKKKNDGVSLGSFKYILPGTYSPFLTGDAGDPRNGSKVQLKHPKTKELCPLPSDGKGWRYSLEYLERIANSKNVHELHDGRFLVLEPHDKKEDIMGLVFGKDEKGVPNTCRIYSPKTDKKVMTTTGYSYRGDKKQGIDPKTGFETVKPTEFLVELLQNYPNTNAKVIDYFAGSGSTAVAVNEANKNDKGSRSWLLVEVNETTLNSVLIPKLTHFEITDYNFLQVKEEEKE